MIDWRNHWALVDKHRALVGKFLFEIVIVFIGVTAAFALESARKDREEQRYRETMIAAMIPLFDDFARTIRRFMRWSRDWRHSSARLQQVRSR